jgi:hypothetical protein
MNTRSFGLWLVLAGFLCPDQAWAQFSDPRAYVETPAGTNQIEAGYAYARGDASIDTSVIVSGAQLQLHQALVDYTRYFGWLNRLMWVEAGVPVAHLAGSITGTNIRRSTAGTGDSSYAFGMMLKGGPVLSEAQLADYTPGTTLGVSFTATAPTGSYDPDRILNLGAHRWSLKPEIGLSHPFGPDQKWVFDLYANAYFYTDNTSYQGREILRQEPLAGLEGHISYSFNDKVWTSFDCRYGFRAATVVDGVNQDNPQRNFILGSETNISLTSRHSLIDEVGKALVHQNGPAVTGISVRYDYSWKTGGP